MNKNFSKCDSIIRSAAKVVRERILVEFVSAAYSFVGMKPYKKSKKSLLTITTIYFRDDGSGRPEVLVDRLQKAILKKKPWDFTLQLKTTEFLLLIKGVFENNHRIPTVFVGEVTLLPKTMLLASLLNVEKFWLGNVLTVTEENLQPLVWTQ